jgi:SAM-dependent methyltransferase
MPDSPPTSPFASPDTWNLVAPAYAVETVPIFETYARAALTLAGVTSGARVVDVAAGPGTLSFLAAREGAAVSAIDFSPGMIAALHERIEREGVYGVDVRIGDGTELPFADSSFDAAFSMFGLMFFPDRDRGFRELHRVLAPGAKAVASSWVDFERVPFIAAIFGALAEVAPAPAAPAPRRPLPLADPAACVAEMSAAGFVDVVVHEVVGTAEYASTNAMVDSLVRTNAPIALMRRSLGDAWPALEAAWRARLVERFGAAAQAFPMPAHLTFGARATR